MSWYTDLAALGPHTMPSSEIFSRPARPNSVNNFRLRLHNDVVNPKRYLSDKLPETSNQCTSIKKKEKKKEKKQK